MLPWTQMSGPIADLSPVRGGLIVSRGVWTPLGFRVWLWALEGGQVPWELLAEEVRTLKDGLRNAAGDGLMGPKGRMRPQMLSVILQQPGGPRALQTRL